MVFVMYCPVNPPVNWAGQVPENKSDLVQILPAHVKICVAALQGHFTEVINHAGQRSFRGYSLPCRMKWSRTQ